jgi:hypothetical protein
MHGAELLAFLVGESRLRQHQTPFAIAATQSEVLIGYVDADSWQEQ